MTTFDPRRSIQERISNLGINRSATSGISALFQLECDGEGCSNHIRMESRELIDEAHRQGFTTDENIRAFVYQALRHKAYQVGWSTERGPSLSKDYCPECLKKGRIRGGDMIRKGSGRRKAKR